MKVYHYKITLNFAPNWCGIITHFHSLMNSEMQVLQPGLAITPHTSLSPVSYGPHPWLNANQQCLQCVSYEIQQLCNKPSIYYIHSCMHYELIIYPCPNFIAWYNHWNLGMDKWFPPHFTGHMMINPCWDQMMVWNSSGISKVNSLIILVQYIWIFTYMHMHTCMSEIVLVNLKNNYSCFISAVFDQNYNVDLYSIKTKSLDDDDYLFLVPLIWMFCLDRICSWSVIENIAR